MGAAKGSVMAFASAPHAHRPRPCRPSWCRSHRLLSGGGEANGFGVVVDEAGFGLSPELTSGAVFVDGFGRAVPVRGGTLLARGSGDVTREVPLEDGPCI